jgi:alpha-mannosidase
MRIAEVASTDLFAGTRARPLQIVRVTLANDGPDMIHDRAALVTVRVQGPGVDTPAPAVVTELARGELRTAEVGVRVSAPLAAGSPVEVTAIAESPLGRWEGAGRVVVAETGWTMWMISHFHYDPVWWNTQGRFAQTWPLLPAEDGSPPEVRTVFELVRLHLAEAKADPDYKFVLAEIDYLKPYFDAHPDDRAELRALLAAGRVEIVGGSYNEPNTNLTCAESTIRNAVYGLGYQRGVLGAEPTTAWMLDAFGFDPAYPYLMAAAGLAESSWARGPFHQWGPPATGDGNRQMQFPAEFEWLSPAGAGLLTSYMPNHYSAGWITQYAPDLATAERDAYLQFSQLAEVAATRNVLLPVGGDHVVPSRWATAIQRSWNERYVWPRFVTAVPSEFFAAVRSEAADRGAWFLPQTRDMNPVYTGKEVSYIDTKQAQRDAEVAVLDGERLATIAWLAGAAYPAASLDKAWRLLAFGAHHDAITGTEGDQVYLDLLAGWREAFERGDDARAGAVRHLASLADTASGAAASGAARCVLVFNTLSWPRSGLARIALEFAQPGARSVRLVDHAGTGVGFLAEPVVRHADGSLAAITLTFMAHDVPALGYRTYLAIPAEGEPAEAGWQPADGLTIENDVFRVTAGHASRGALASIMDLRSGTELLAGPGNELVLAQEYPSHPQWGEGPWLLCTTGAARGSASVAAAVRAERCPAGSRLIAEFALDGLRVTQETLLWDGAGRVEFRTHVDGSIGQDRLLRVRFGTDVPGGLPVYQTGLSVIGRSAGPANVDVARHTYTMDNPAHEWFGVGSTARVALASASGRRHLRAIGVAEVIVPAGPATERFAPRDRAAGSGHRPAIRDLMVALARQGVTATCSVPDGPRYGSVALDSNLPDVRIALGGPAENAFTAQVVAIAGTELAVAIDKQLAQAGTARIWVPAVRSGAERSSADADLRGPADLPVLIVAGHDLNAAIEALIDDLADAEIEVPQQVPELASGAASGAEPDLAGHSVALFNRGLPGSLVTPGGDAYISLMRACSAWPSGIWLDGEKRTVPDGSSFAWQHWSHTFEYALASGQGDWRAAGYPQAAQEYSHRLLTCETGVHGGSLPPAASLAGVTPAGVDLMALKPRGNPLAPGAQPDPADGVTVRLRDLGGLTWPASATVRLPAPIEAANITGLLEQDDGAPASCQAGKATVTVPERGTVTLAVRLAGLAAGADHGAAVTGAAPEPAQPVFTRYWLHGKGPAPAGNLPVAVHLSPALLALRPGGRGTLRLTVACVARPASGTVTVDIPDGLDLAGAARAHPDGGPGQEAAGPGRRELPYDLSTGDFAAWELAVQARSRQAPGRYFIAARILDEAGQVLEDAVVVTVGEGQDTPPDLSLAALAAQLEQADAAEAAEAELTAVTGDLELRPGGQGELTVRLRNNTAAELRGEAQPISPFGSWAAITPWSTGFAVGPGAQTTLRFAVRVPRDARTGERWWALVKVMYFGRLRYSEPVWICVV